MINFYKYQSTGNDFIILHNPDNFDSVFTEQKINQLCHRRFGIGADGLMVLKPHQDCDFEMVYYNADGKLGSLCGNGSRAICKFAFDKGLVGNEVRFLASDGFHNAVINVDWVEIQMQDINHYSITERFIEIDTGSPHYVEFKEGVQSMDVYSEGRKVRNSEQYKKEGINVNFVDFKDNILTVRTYERGVEDETFSCGTGVTASALAGALKGKFKNAVDVRTIGGNLQVRFESLKKGFNNIWLCGPSEFVYKGQLKQ